MFHLERFSPLSQLTFPPFKSAEKKTFERELPAWSTVINLGPAIVAPQEGRENAIFMQQLSYLAQ